MLFFYNTISFYNINHNSKLKKINTIIKAKESEI